MPNAYCVQNCETCKYERNNIYLPLTITINIEYSHIRDSAYQIKVKETLPSPPH